ncbi:MAG: class I SAM-dependent methyltransferase [Cyanobium sp.]
MPFRTYMEWALHDPEHGAYGAGRLSIGPSGDFATAPSLGPDFAALLLIQLIEWLELLAAAAPGRISLVESGPGEGTLALELARGLVSARPDLAGSTELVLVEPNPGMAARQRRLLQECPLPCRWISFADLAAAPVRGVLLAHEVLDALAVERIVWNGALWSRQRVVLEVAGASIRLETGEPLKTALQPQLQALGLLPPSPLRPAGWSTELHPALEPWLAEAAAALEAGVLLVIDYALEAWRYYAPQRSGGTLMAYRGQVAGADPLLDPGELDLTAHLCIDALQAAAAGAGWSEFGQCRQGQALLALGLAQRLHSLQQGDPADLPMLLQRREALLRLVDPHALGDFRWLAFRRGPALPAPLFVQEPPSPNG